MPETIAPSAPQPALPSPDKAPPQQAPPQSINDEPSFDDEIDRLAGVTPKPKAPPKTVQKPEKAADPKKEPQPKKAEPPKKAPDKKEEPKTQAPDTEDNEEESWDVEEPPKKEIKDDKEVHAPAELRQAYERTKKRTEELEAELAKLKSTPADDPEKQKLTELLKAREERLSKLEEEMKFVAYERSSEYAEKYDQPMIQAFRAGQAKTKSLKVIDPESGETRPGTPEDFQAIMQIMDDDAAAELANEMFGTKASMVLYHRERVMELNSKRLEALDQFRKTAKEREEKLQAETIAKQEATQTALKQRAELFHKIRDEAAEKYPHLFKPVEGDEKGNELLERGYARVDQVFGKKPENMTLEQTVKLHAMVRNKAGAFDRLNYKYKQGQARIAELEAELKQFRESGPDGGTVRRGERKDGELTIDQEIDALAVQNARR